MPDFVSQMLAQLRGEMLSNSMFYGEPALLRDAGISKIKYLAPPTLSQKCLGLSDQRLPSATVSNS